MKKIIENIRKDKVIHYIIIIAASLIAAIPLINLRIYGTDDGYVHKNSGSRTCIFYVYTDNI